MQKITTELFLRESRKQNRPGSIRTWLESLPLKIGEAARFEIKELPKTLQRCFQNPDRIHQVVALVSAGCRDLRTYRFRARREGDKALLLMKVARAEVGRDH